MNIDDYISVKDFSEKNGFHRQSVFKVIKRLEIEPEKIRGGKESRGQMISYITKKEAKKVFEELTINRNITSQQTNTTEAALYDIGVFYLLVLEPKHDPNRFKVGFTNNINERMRQHKCSAPFVRIIQTWPCRRLWEKTAIECITYDCEQLHTEVFRSNSIDEVLSKGNQFFNLMPKLNN